MNNYCKFSVGGFREFKKFSINIETKNKKDQRLYMYIPCADVSRGQLITIVLDKLQKYIDFQRTSIFL